jgi:predicted nucleotidyltransferase
MDPELRGSYKPFSDIDITLVGEDISHRDLLQIMNDIDDLLLPYMFDISIFHTLRNEELIEHINRRGAVIYRKVEL